MLWLTTLFKIARTQSSILFDNALVTAKLNYVNDKNMCKHLNYIVLTVIY